MAQTIHIEGYLFSSVAVSRRKLAQKKRFPTQLGNICNSIRPIEFLVSSIATLGQTIRFFNSERELRLCEFEEHSAVHDHPQVPHRHV
jgi:hypothetical protein